MKRLLILLTLVLVGIAATACDSTPQIGTATARAQSTNVINLTLTAIAAPDIGVVAPIVPTSLPGTSSAIAPAGLPATAPVTTSTALPAVSTQAATRAATSPATLPATQAATAEPTKVAQNVTPGGPGSPTPTPVNAIMATVFTSRTQTAIAPTATPLVLAERAVSWFDHATLYSLYVRSFRDSNGDGIGDLQGVIDGLDYLQSLGVDSIWLLPVFKSPSAHGYDITDYYSVNPDYGTNADLTRLIKAVHARKMTILLDYVVNHTSDQHPYFKDAFNNPKSDYSDFYTWGNAEHTKYDTFAGVQNMPKLNYDSPKVVQFSTDIALYWLDPDKDGDFSDGVDGFRCDVANGPFRTFWQSLRQKMSALNPRSLLLGELFVQTPQDMLGYLGEGRLDAAFDFPLYRQMAGNWDVNGDGIISGKGDPALAYGLARNPQNFYAFGSQLVRFIGNHDTNRVASEVAGDLPRMEAAAVFLMSAPGPVVMYYGDEIGMMGSKCAAPDYDNCRREPLEWYRGLQGAGQTTWFTRNNKADDSISVEEQSGRPDSLLTLYRQLGQIRALHKPATSTLAEGKGDESGLYVFESVGAGTTLNTIINFGAQPVVLSDATAAAINKHVMKCLTLIRNAREGGATYTIQPGGFLLTFEGAGCETVMKAP